MNSNFVRIDFNDIAKFSNSAFLLIESDLKDVKRKSKSEILREYELEKWAEVNKWLEERPYLTHHDINFLRFGSNESAPIYLGNEFYLAPPLLAYQEHIKLYLQKISPFYNNASSLVELGAGYGSILFDLYLNGFSTIPIFAGELTQSGINAIERISTNLDIDIASGYCDLESLQNMKIEIPKKSIIFTSYAAHYSPVTSEEFVNQICKLDPLVVFHFEPIYDHYPINTIHGLMCRKYIKLNDYNTNLLSILKTKEMTSDIKILEEAPMLIGSNPFLPISAISWQPA
jgi:hypothetical protein